MTRTAFTCRLVSWTGVYALTHRLALRILAAGFRPDMVVAIARGGYVPARLLCDLLHLDTLTSLQVEHYAQGAQKKACARLKYPLGADPSDRRVLVVDDICDSGETYHVVLRHLAEFDTAAVKTAALQLKEGASYAPDFIGRRIYRWHWVIYPWAVIEDVTGFIEQLEGRPAMLSDLRNRLRAEFGLGLEERRLRDICRLIGYQPRP